jgi:hypothetical protein
MTDTDQHNGPTPPTVYPPPERSTPLPAEVVVSQAFARRAPSQRVIDQLARLDPTPFSELLQTGAFRVMAFRVLLRDYPRHDVASLWLHAYDVEVEIEDAVDPTSALAPTFSPPSAPTTE